MCRARTSLAPHLKIPSQWPSIPPGPTYDSKPRNVTKSSSSSAVQFPEITSFRGVLGAVLGVGGCGGVRECVCVCGGGGK